MVERIEKITSLILNISLVKRREKIISLVLNIGLVILFLNRKKEVVS